jgi:membrane-associated phospholipid phosphatase
MTSGGRMDKKQNMLAGMIPGYSFVPVILALLLNQIAYFGSRAIAGEWYHYNLEISLDGKIPFWPPAVLIYLGSYLFWAASYILLARQEKEKAYQFFLSESLSRLVCMSFFLMLPTTNTRPAVEIDGIWNQLMIYLYSADAADNLFPSIHCLESWLCFIGMKNRRGTPRWYQIFSCITAVLICISTLLTKQHVIVDVIGGILIAELCFSIGKRSAVLKIYGTWMDKINKA